MEAAPSCCSSADKSTLEVDRLLEVFGSSFSLEEITSALKQANSDTAMAGEILSTLQATASSSDVNYPEDPEPSLTSSASVGDNNISQNLKLDEPNGTDLKIKEVPATVGCQPGTTERDTAEFLFKMLGDGFQLDKNVIYEVLGTCGYDMNKSIEKLLDLSASTLEKSDDVLSRPSKTDPISVSCQDKLENPNGPRSRVKRKKGKTDSEREILLTLFTTKQLEVEPKKIVPPTVRRSRAYGTLVTEPLKDPTIEHTTLSVRPLDDSGNGSEDGNAFENLRQAVKEHWSSMKEYYISAIEAFEKGDSSRAYRLLEQGKFFSLKAREADEKSAEMLETDNSCRYEEVLLDLTIHKPKEAVKLLSLQLSHLCGIPSIPYMKVKVGNSDGDGQERSRKRWILKYLEKKEVKWSESESGQMITIRVDEINPESLSCLM